MKNREVLTVSEISSRVAQALTAAFPEVWVRGEVSEFTSHSSGHWYFTLKDEKAQLRAVMFKHLNRYLRVRPESGQEVVCRGRLRAYAPRSVYQLEVEWIEPVGVGALYLQFEQLKAKLEREGLFDPRSKRPIPSPLRRVAIITSISGAALQDILRILRERDPAIEVLILPAPVQGEGAAKELARMVALANRPQIARPADRKPLEAIIIGRGGGSIDDLWAFNEEVLARALAASDLPVISAVGHETDFTIADFVADLRAPTPTAAAEIIAAGKAERRERLLQARHRLYTALAHGLERADSGLENLEVRFPDLRSDILDFMVRCDELSDRAARAVSHSLGFTSQRLAADERAFAARDPRNYYRLHRAELIPLVNRLQAAHAEGLAGRRHVLDTLSARLDALSPRATLARGFAIARDRQGRVVRAAESMTKGDDLELILHRGRLGVRVEDVNPEDPV